MIELRISPGNESHHLLREKLEEMSLAHKVIESEKYEIPQLTLNKEVHSGATEIDQALEKLRSFKEDWYQCLCDEWPESAFE